MFVSHSNTCQAGEVLPTVASSPLLEYFTGFRTKTTIFSYFWKKKFSVPHLDTCVVVPPSLYLPFLHQLMAAVAFPSRMCILRQLGALG